MSSRCKHCLVWSKRANQLVSNCVYCGHIFIVYKEYNEETDRKLINESYKNYSYIHKKYGCIARHLAYNDMKQKTYNKLANL